MSEDQKSPHQTTDVWVAPTPWESWSLGCVGHSEAEAIAKAQEHRQQTIDQLERRIASIKAVTVIAYRADAAEGGDDEWVQQTTPFPTDAMHEIANKHSRECMAAIGREVVRGAAGWKFGADPQDFIREAIMNALRDALGDQHAPE